MPGPFEQAREQREHARRVAPRRRRLAGGETDLALGHGEAGEGVHQQQDVVALVAEPLGDAGRKEGGPDAHERRLVGGGDDDDGAAQSFLAEVALDELGDLSPTLADERDDGRRRPRCPA